MFRFNAVEKGKLKVLELSNGHGTGASFVPERGGILTELTLSEVAVFYLDADTLPDFSKNIRGGNPVLFPICGPLENGQYITDSTVDGAVYRMKQHGFARNFPWQISLTEVSTKMARVVLQLESDAETLQVFPFDFRLEFTYEIYPESVLIKQRYINLSSQAMPFYGGFHPYFLLPDLEMKELYIPSPSYHDLKTATSHSFSGSLDLRVKEETNLVFTDLTDNQAWFRRKDGTKITVEFDGNFRYVVLWALRDREFVCIEPWMGNNYDMNRGRALVLEPGEELRAEVSYSVDISKN